MTTKPSSWHRQQAALGRQRRVIAEELLTHDDTRAYLVAELIADPGTWAQIRDHAQAALRGRTDEHGRQVLGQLADIAAVLAEGGQALQEAS